MSGTVRKSIPFEERPDEKQFYLEVFRGRTLCLAVSLADCEDSRGFASLGSVLCDLLANRTRLVVLVGVPASRGDDEGLLREVRRHLRPFALSEGTASLFPRLRGRRSVAGSFVDLRRQSLTGTRGQPTLGLFWEVLRTQPLFVGLVRRRALLDLAQQVSVELKLHKLVITESAGGLSTAREMPLSFMNGAMLDTTLQAGEAEWAGLASRRRTLEAVRTALNGGVQAVNLCRLDGLDRELFTYEGSGTLFTLEDYCRVERLGIDDFEQVGRLIARGQREGYLKTRSSEEVTEILLHGYGATIGANQLAGVCALVTEPYRKEKAGEVVAVSTITRFKGEGVGGRLIARVMTDAREMGLRYVFACTTEARAQAFFEREGFCLVSPDDVPRSKWIGYDPGRLALVSVYRREVVSGSGKRAG